MMMKRILILFLLKLWLLFTPFWSFSLNVAPSVCVFDWISHYVINIDWRVIKEWWLQVEYCAFYRDAALIALCFLYYSPSTLRHSHMYRHILSQYFTSILIFSTAQRENKSQLIQALHRRNQIPAQAWQTRSKFWKSSTVHEPSPHIWRVCSNIYLLSWFLICVPFEFPRDLFISFTVLWQNT